MIAKKLFAHFMVSFSTPSHLGEWRGWEYTNATVSHNPDELKDGKRDIASVYYPVIGPYDMADPDLVEYHCQQLKMAGIDGGMFDLGLYDDVHADSMRLYTECFKRYGLEAAVIFEDKARFIWDDTLKDRPSTVEAGFKDLDGWLEMFDDVQYKVDGKPLLGFFSYASEVPGKGKSCFSPAELQEWLDRWVKRGKTRPWIVRQWYNEVYTDLLDGQYDWPMIVGKPVDGIDAYQYNDFATEKEYWSQPDKAYKERKNRYTLPIGGVWPGFDDEGCWGWGGGHRLIPRFDGEVYKYHWERVIEQGFEIVQIATWNDWFEGSNVEPAEEFGYKYLELTRSYVSKWKGIGEEKNDLRIPEWIYKLRKRADSEEMNSTLLHACNSIASGDYRGALELIRPLLPKIDATV